MPIGQLDGKTFVIKEKPKPKKERKRFGVLWNWGKDPAEYDDAQLVCSFFNIENFEDNENASRQLKSAITTLVKEMQEKGEHKLVVK